MPDVYLTIATAGHIDHGKSTLVQSLTGTHPDRLPEEKTRGISIDLGFAHVGVGDVTLSFVDVPGHERFVRTMLAGVGGIDAVLLVVAADESVMPQTREHLDICRLLDVPTGVIALTRCDLADETMQAVAEDDVRALVAGTFLADAPIVRVSARSGEGLDAVRQALVACAATRRARHADMPVRLPVDRAFTVKGFGTVVTGTLWSGTLSPEAELTLWPAGGRVRVRGLQVHGAPASNADAGQRVAVNLAGLALADVERGHVLLGEGAALSSRRLAVEVDVLPEAPAQRHGTRVHVHLGTSVALGRLLLPAGSAADAPRTLGAGSRGPAILRLESSLPARRGDRLVLRAYSPLATVAGARVVDPAPLPRAGTARDDAAADVEATLLARVREAGPLGCADGELPARCGASPGEIERLCAALERAGTVVRAGDYWVAAEAFTTVRAAVLAAIDDGIAADPLAGGVPRASLRAIGRRRWRGDVVDLVLAQLAHEGVVAGDERVARAGGTGERAPVDARVLSAVDGAGLPGRTAQELAEGEPDLDRKALAAVLARLVKAREIERVGDLHIAAARLRVLADELRQLAGSGTAPATIEVGWFKERYGLTRRTAIPLLEWLDRTRVTRRQGDARVLVGGG